MKGKQFSRLFLISSQMALIQLIQNIRELIGSINCLFFAIVHPKYPLLILSLLLAYSVYTRPVYAEESKNYLLALSLADLQLIEFDNTFSLTKTNYRNIPAAHTIITRDMIEDSGARDLDELLEIYVPSMHSLHHTTLVGRRFSTRGIVSNDTVLMLVNGRVMNERRFGGAQSERAVSMLGDIESIEVIRGPGAAVHGAGALAAVININTFSGNTFEGADISIRQGVFEEFTNAELRFGKHFSSDNQLFLYYGIDSYEGGDNRYSPFTLGSSHSTYQAGDVLRDRISNVNQSLRDKLRHKAHIQWNIGDFEGWARYVKGGVNIATGPDIANQTTLGGSGYDQLTLMLTHEKDFGEHFKLSTKLSYDYFNAVQIRDSPAWKALFVSIDKNLPNPAGLGFLEQQFLSGIAINWTPSENHEIHLGYEFSYDWHAEEGLGWPHQNLSKTLHATPWESYMHSYIAEYQWQIADRFTLTAGGRIDDHSLVDKLMISPRAALIFRQSAERTFKMIFNHSVRRADEQDLKFFAEKDLEDIDYFEFIYHQQINDNLSSELSTFYALHDLINYSATTRTTRPIGQTEFTGFDWELKYLSEKWQTLFSVSYVKLLNLRLKNLNNSNSISAEPQGFGDDFAEVPNWTFKLNSRYQLNKHWNFNGSVIADLGSDGRRDRFEGLKQRAVDSKIDNGVIRLNLGTGYQFNDQLKINLNAHNILGWLDRDLNNRFYRGKSDYRPDVASFSIGVRYKF